MRFSSTEVPENKKTKHHCHFALLWGSATVSFLTWGENETKKKGAVYKTHTFFTHAVKKTRDTNRNDVKNVLRRKIKQNKKRKTFHAEIWTAGWTNIKSVRARRSHVCRLQHARRFFFRGNMQFICLQHDVKNTLKYFRVHGKVRRRFKTIKTQNILKMSQSSECRGGTTTETRADMITVVHCTKLELTVIENRCEHRQKNCWNLRESIYNVHIIWGRRYRQSLFTRSAMMREREKERKRRHVWPLSLQMRTVRKQENVHQKQINS